MNATVGERKCAVLLAGLHAEDRGLLISQLPEVTRERLSALVRDAVRLRLDAPGLAGNLSGGVIPMDPLEDASLAAASPSIDRLPRGLPEAWRGRIRDALGESSVSKGAKPGHISSLPPLLRQALVEEARALVAREREAA